MEGGGTRRRRKSIKLESGKAGRAGGRQRVEVAVRVRPIFASESGAGQRCVVDVDEMTNAVHITKVARAGAVLRSELGNDYVYQFDHAYGPKVGRKGGEQRHSPCAAA